MTLAEFKAWFEGYTESMDSTPSEKQWTRIKARVKEIDGTPVTREIFVDRYWPTWPRPLWDLTYCGNNTGLKTTAGDSGAAAPYYNATWVANGNGDGALFVNDEKFDVHATMYALGKAEAEAA